MTELIQSDSTELPLGLRLNGWKEIAAYLERGIRTAQRWEREFGLPVRRLGRDRSESVFAFSAEIDHWMTTASGASARRVAVAGTLRPVGAETGGPQDTPVEPSGSTESLAAEIVAPRPTGTSRTTVWALVGIILVLLAIGAWREWTFHRTLSAMRGPRAHASVLRERTVASDNTVTPQRSR